MLGGQGVVPQRHFNYVDLFAMGAEAIPNRKHFAKAAKPLRGRSDGTVT